jgi:exosortase H (IPTLxxWG-CTERM-specific)
MTDNRQPIRFLVKFFGTILVLYLVLALKPVDRHVVVPFTTVITAVAAQILNLIGYSVTTAGTLMRDGTFVVDVKNGCNGLEAMLLLCSAILASPAPWRARLGGFIFGALFIQVVNLFRIVTLFIAGRDYPRFFDTLHVTVWQGVIFLLTIAVFVTWNWRFSGSPARAEPR